MHFAKQLWLGTFPFLKVWNKLLGERSLPPLNFTSSVFLVKAYASNNLLNQQSYVIEYICVHNSTKCFYQDNCVRGLSFLDVWKKIKGGRDLAPLNFIFLVLLVTLYASNNLLNQQIYVIKYICVHNTTKCIYQDNCVRGLPFFDAWKKHLGGRDLSPPQFHFLVLLVKTYASNNLLNQQSYVIKYILCT